MTACIYRERLGDNSAKYLRLSYSSERNGNDNDLTLKEAFHSPVYEASIYDLPCLTIDSNVYEGFDNISKLYCLSNGLEILDRVWHV